MVDGELEGKNVTFETPNEIENLGLAIGVADDQVSATENDP